MYYALIMAGGSGTRLWPLSRQNRPKQSLKLVGDRTMFQQAVDRLEPLFKPEQILVVTRREHVSILQAQTPNLPVENFIVEPEGPRNCTSHWTGCPSSAPQRSPGGDGRSYSRPLYRQSRTV